MNLVSTGILLVLIPPETSFWLLDCKFFEGFITFSQTRPMKKNMLEVVLKP